MRWWISGFFTVLIVLFTLVVWREQKSGGACFEQHDSQNAENESYPCRLITPANLPTDYLVIIGIGGVFVAIFTLKSIHHQAVQVRKQTRIFKESADTAEKAANAALLNAQAVITSERAWLVPAAEFIRPNALPTRGLANSHVETVTIRIENCGRTPAWLLDWSVEVAVLDDTNIGQLMDAGRPEGDFPNARPFPQGRTEDFSIEWTTNWAEITQIKSGQKQLYVYGFLQYRSIAENEPRNSRFCFHYFHKRNNIGGFDEGWAAEPPEENHYT